jgi:hypothetical protein
MVRSAYVSPVRGGYRMILPEWQPLGRTVAGQQFTGRVEVRTPLVESGWDQATHTPLTSGGTLVVAAPGRLQSIGQETTENNAGQMVTTNRYRLSIEWRDDVSLEVGQVAKFTEGVSLWLLNRPLQVTALLLSSLEWQHDVEVEADFG